MERGVSRTKREGGKVIGRVFDKASEYLEGIHLQVYVRTYIGFIEHET